ncbi:MAG: hypothetical protein ACI8RD_011284 [Bacillariaceae sp.]|jgi:hypothetical protein
MIAVCAFDRSTSSKKKQHLKIANNIRYCTVHITESSHPEKQFKILACTTNRDNLSTVLKKYSFRVSNMTIRFQGMLILGLSALILFAEVGYAFVNSPSPSFAVKTSLPMLPKASKHQFFHHSLDLGHSNLHINTAERTSFLPMAMENGDGEKSPTSNLPFWLDPGTRGGAVVLGIILFIIPFIGYSIATNVFGIEGVDAGKWIGVGFTAGATLLWVFTYIFRVATKDMTYVSLSVFRLDFYIGIYTRPSNLKVNLY